MGLRYQIHQWLERRSRKQLQILGQLTIFIIVAIWLSCLIFGTIFAIRASLGVRAFGIASIDGTAASVSRRPCLTPIGGSAQSYLFSPSVGSSNVKPHKICTASGSVPQTSSRNTATSACLTAYNDRGELCGQHVGWPLARDIAPAPHG
jgi:hypothetical protein